MNIPDNLLYTKEHEWVSINGSEAKMGITDHAQGSLGDITFVDLPKLGALVEQSKGCSTIESVKAASDVYAPLSGRILKTNDELLKHPEFVNQFPYDKGYIAVIEIKDAKEKSNLMSAADYRKHVESLK